MYSTTVAWVIQQPEFYGRLAKGKTVKIKKWSTFQPLFAWWDVGESETKSNVFGTNIKSYVCVNQTLRLTRSSSAPPWRLMVAISWDQILQIWVECGGRRKGSQNKYSKSLAWENLLQFDRKLWFRGRYVFRETSVPNTGKKLQQC